MRSARSFPRWTVTVLALATWLVAGVSAARAVSASPYGVNVHAPAGAQLQESFARVQEAGIGWVRVDFVWAAVEVQRGKFDWRLYDALVADAQRRGLSVLGILAYTPAWATDGPEISGVPSNPAEWQRFCTRAARRYRGRVAVWEVWNEPNLERFWAGSRQQYLDVILKPAADAIHAMDPKALVAGPGLAHVGSRDWHHWLLDTLRAAGGKIDVVTHHLYDVDGPADVTKKLDGSTPFANQPGLWDVSPPSVREVLKAANARGKPFWLTETGWESDIVGDDRQADDYAEMLDAWLGGGTRNWIRKIFFYELRDGTAEFSWGIVRADGSPKPAFDAYRDFVAAHPPAP
jgi:polysaccharide biosynthesis protein PslG